jgi:hypothetical protein
MKEVRARESEIATTQTLLYREFIEERKSQKKALILAEKRAAKEELVHKLTVEYANSVYHTGSSHRSVADLNRKADMQRLVTTQQHREKVVARKARVVKAADYIHQVRVDKRADEAAFNELQRIKRDCAHIDRELARENADQKLAMAARAKQELAEQRAQQLQSKMKSVDYVMQGAERVPARGREPIHVRITKHASKAQDTPILERLPPERTRQIAQKLHVEAVEALYVDNNAEVEEMDTWRRQFSKALKRKFHVVSQLVDNFIPTYGRVSLRSELLTRQKIRVREEVAIKHVKTEKAVNHMENELEILYNADRSYNRLARPRAAPNVPDNGEHPDVLYEFEREFWDKSKVCRVGDDDDDDAEASPSRHPKKTTHPTGKQSFHSPTSTATFSDDSLQLGEEDDDENNTRGRGRGGSRGLNGRVAARTEPVSIRQQAPSSHNTDHHNTKKNGSSVLSFSAEEWNTHRREEMDEEAGETYYQHRAVGGRDPVFQPVTHDPTLLGHTRGHTRGHTIEQQPGEYYYESRSPSPEALPLHDAHTRGAATTTTTTTQAPVLMPQSAHPPVSARTQHLSGSTRGGEEGEGDFGDSSYQYIHEDDSDLWYVILLFTCLHILLAFIIGWIIEYCIFLFAVWIAICTRSM